MAQIVIDGSHYEVPDGLDFTLGELADMEQVAGCPIDSLPENSTRMVLALLYVTLRRNGRDVTVDDVRALRPGEFQFVEGDETPTVAGDQQIVAAGSGTQG